VKINAKIILDEDYPNEGVIVRKEPEHMIIPVPSIRDYTSISVSTIKQKLHVPYEHSLRLLQYLIRCLFSNTRVMNDYKVPYLLVEN